MVTKRFVRAQPGYKTFRPGYKIISSNGRSYKREKIYRELTCDLLTNVRLTRRRNLASRGLRDCSIGGLGQGNSQACVSNIIVQDVFIRGTQNGVRIKTWQGGSGVVHHVTFDRVTVVNVQNPIVISQFYCDAKECQNDTAAVLISDISFRNIQGTYDQLHSYAPIHFACSDTVPCCNIEVDNVDLLPAEPTPFPSPSYCLNSYGASGPSCFPAVCLINEPFLEDSAEYY